MKFSKMKLGENNLLMYSEVLPVRPSSGPTKTGLYSE